MKLNIFIFSFCLSFCLLKALPAQEEDHTIMYLNPFQKTQMIDDYLLLTDNLGLTLDRIPMLNAPDGTALHIEPDHTPAYLKFNGTLYPIGDERNLESLSPFITENQIDYLPINVGPIDYQEYYHGLPLDDTEHLGIKLLEYGFLEKLKINQ